MSARTEAGYRPGSARLPPAPAVWRAPLRPREGFSAASFLLAAALGLGFPVLPRLRAQQRPGRATAPASVTAVVTVFDPSGAVIPRAQVELGPPPRSGRAAHLRMVLSGPRGQARFAALAAGAAVLHVSASGFAPVTLFVQLQPGPNAFRVPLRLAPVRQRVRARAPAASASTTAFSFVLTPQQIEQLPDDPDQFQAALQALAGPAAGPEGPTIVVDGFSGGQLPPKSQIQTIIIDLNPYSAANHTATGARIEIFTRPGAGAWHGQMSAAGRATSFDARNAFSADETPEAYRRFGINLEGPLESHQSSVFISLRALPTYDSTTILATTPAGLEQGLAIQPAKEVFGRVQVNQALSRTLSLRVEYQRNYHGADEQGVGGLALSSRAYSTANLENLLRLSLTGTIGMHAVNQMRFQADWQDAGQQSALDAPALTVAGAFESGGAQTETATHASDWQLDDDFSYSLGAHLLHAGFRVNQGVYQIENASNALGSFTFASLADFAAGRPSLFTQRLGYPWVGFPFAEWAGYFQDDWQASPRLAVSLGVRYEGQTNVPDDHGWAPRFMLTWAPWGGQTLLRVGGGLFNDFLDSGTYSDTLLDNGVQQYDVTILDPGYPDPAASGAPHILPPSIITLEPGLLLPYREQGSVTLSRPFAGGFRLMTGYFYQRGVHEFRSRNLNAPLPGAPPGDVPFPGQGNLNQVESDGNSLYQALRIGVSHFSARQFFAVNYALAQSLNDNDGALSLPANNYDLAADWGPSSNDANDRLFAMWNWGLTRSLRLFTMFHAQSALPYTITTGGISQNGQTNTRPPGVGRNSARGDSQWDINTRLSWTYAWGPPPTDARTRRPGGARRGPGSGGAGGRSAFGDRRGGRGGFGRRGAAASDHRFSLEFYVQAYNVLNHVSFTSFDGVLGSPLFGQPLAAAPARRLETGLWFRF